MHILFPRSLGLRDLTVWGFRVHAPGSGDSRPRIFLKAICNCKLKFPSCPGRRHLALLHPGRPAHPSHFFSRATITHCAPRVCFVVTLLIRIGRHMSRISRGARAARLRFLSLGRRSCCLALSGRRVDLIPGPFSVEAAISPVRPRTLRSCCRTTVCPSLCRRLPCRCSPGRAGL
jgi:hypothetical protein